MSETFFNLKHSTQEEKIHIKKKLIIEIEVYFSCNNEITYLSTEIIKISSFDGAFESSNEWKLYTII